MPSAILALNAGSSSLKFGLYEIGPDRHSIARALRGKVSGTGSPNPTLEAFGSDGEAVAAEEWSGEPGRHVSHRLIEWVEGHLGSIEISAVGHRIVHGGRDFHRPVVVDGTVIDALDALTPLAPLHQPASLAPVRELAEVRPKLFQVACFDTAFHHKLKPPVSRYPLPRHIEELGVRRFGFHGLSYESIVGKLRGEDGTTEQRIIVAHLGSGASLCALRNLESADTTMGFTALDGLMMATRPGALDPGILLYLQRAHLYDLDALETLLYHESGLKGVSGLSDDIAVLLKTDTSEAREAVDLFTFQVARQICALAATIGGIDTIVFTGGIGENAWQIRASIADRLAWLGVALDPTANRQNAEMISAPQSTASLRVISTDEEGTIAAHTLDLLRAARA